MDKNLKLYLTTIFTAAFLVFLRLGSSYIFDFALNEVLFFTAALLILSNMSMLFNSISKVITSMNLPILLTTFVVLNPFWAAVVSAVGTTEFKTRESGFIWFKFLFNRAVFFLSAAAGALAFNFTQARLGESGFPFSALLAASLIYFLVDNILVYIVLYLAENDIKQTSLINYFFELSKNLVTSYFIGIILFASYIYFGKVFFALVIVLLYVIKDFFYSRLQQINSYTQIVESFLKVIDSKDHYTEGHCKRVAYYTYHLCKQLGLSKTKSEKIINVAKIHDIGKIYVNDEVLKSSDKLSNTQYQEIKKHAVYGYQLLKDIDILKEELDVLLHHHERWDGTGYPDGLSEKEIPIGARILNITDSFDVMTTGRSYKAPLTKMETIEELEICSGSQFDPEIAAEMIKLIEDGHFDNNFLREDLISEYQFSIEY
ncbi:HD-GYP domain-containing protein [Halanaerobium hydrogeniformans]|uniref:Metal dependent phosphohydrolase n=1 Tax=Halanaerobium hydrogeniformans TaxID=656519 RepID=E4RMY3_HALHG|nr:HD-GYP domain-containing protein [Halanaerobium hydrogeniformans]ADQ14200.1 metal dependent phosphohydrolase [Halanaerobium hydrogeniformans]